MDGTAVASCQYNGMNQLVKRTENGIDYHYGYDRRGRRKEEEESGGSGLQGQLRYTSYSFDPVIGKYFAQARFYDAEQGRMMGKDPVKRGVNGYPYCDNDPVNYVDPTGEIANIIAGGIAGGVIGGAFGFAGSAVSQLMSGERFSMRKALGSAANGAVVGAVRGALVGSGIGIGTSLAANFIGGAVGSALEQKIGSGSVSLKESLVGGATNAVSGAIYGDGPLKGFGDALWKGAASGAATAGIRYLARDWDEGGSDLAGSVLGLAQGIGQMAISPYAKNRDPRKGCGVRSPLSNRIGEAMAYGYRYDVGFLKSAGSVRRKKEGFSMLGLLKEAAVGGVMGGLAGTAFYGAGKAFGFLKDSVRDVRGNRNLKNSLQEGNELPIKMNLQFFGKKSDIKQVEQISKKFNMTANQRRDFGDYIESLKRHKRNDANFSWKELMQIAESFMGGE